VFEQNALATPAAPMIVVTPPRSMVKSTPSSTVWSPNALRTERN
jgi:hypothetical protein